MTSNTMKNAKEITFNTKSVNIKGFLYIIAPLLLYVIIYRSLFYGKLAPIGEFLTVKLLLMTIASISIHEFLHGVGWRLSKQCNSQNIHFKFQWLMASCHCDVALSGKQYIIGLLFPLFFLGSSTILLSFLAPSVFTMLLGLINLVACGGDLLLAFNMLKFKNSIIMDHPTKAGFIILEE